jgi:hypothetical protein
MSAKRLTLLWSASAVLSAILALSAWAFASPSGASPDDDYHLSSTWCAQGVREDLCETIPGKNESLKVPYSVVANQYCFAFQSDVNGSCPYNNELYETSRLNNILGYYPPVYYWTMSWLASTDVYTSVLSMRIANGLLAVVLLSALIVALPNHLRRVPIYAFLIPFIPLGIFLMASNNPSSWAYLGVITLFSALTGFLSVDKPKPKLALAILSLLGVLLAAGSRADAAAYSLLAIALAFVISFSKGAFKPVNAIVGGALSSITLLSFLYLSRQGTIAAGGVMSGPKDPDLPIPSVLINLTNLPQLWTGVFGTWGLGWVDTLMPPLVWVSMLSIYAAVVFSAVRWFDFRQSISFGLVFLALVFVPMYILSINRLVVGQDVQPRYLLPLMALLVAVALFRSSSTTGLIFSRGQVWIVGAILVLANSVSLNTNLRRYISGIDIKSFNLDNTVEWWWPNFTFSPNAVWLIGSTFFALLLISLWNLRFALALPGASSAQKVAAIEMSAKKSNSSLGEKKD